jgi:hypothetical protein
MSSPLESTKDFRRSATSVIWGCATGMLAICLSLTNQPHQGDRGTVISLAILAGATISTVAVWRVRPDHDRLVDSDQIKALQERITNLEMIASSGEMELQHLGSRDPLPTKLDKSQ